MLYETDLVKQFKAFPFLLAMVFMEFSFSGKKLIFCPKSIMSGTFGFIF